MNEKERKSCINTINMLRRLALNIHGYIDVVDNANCDKLIGILEGENVKALSPDESNVARWIPLTTRPMDDDEKEHYKEQLEYLDGARIFNCPLPDDGQEVLITIYGGTEIDTFIKDENDGCYFEGRDIEDVRAWMPLPDPYKKKSGVK